MAAGEGAGVRAWVLGGRRARCRAPREAHVYRICFTGGPCAGKTTAIARLRSYLSDRGFRVFDVPEAATLLATHGAHGSSHASEDQMVAFQLHLLRTQIYLEDTFYSLACSTKRPAVVLSDRGTLDGKGYVPRKVWHRILEAAGVDELKLRDARYDAVLHLVTAAKGAESFYQNDAVRTETAAEARQVDARLKEAWIGHPRLMVFDNSTDFETKLQRVVRTVSNIVNLPHTRKTFRRFLLREPPQAVPRHAKTFEVEKVYLRTMSEGAEGGGGGVGTMAPPAAPARAATYTFVRRRSRGKYASFGETTVTVNADGERVEAKRIIGAREFAFAVTHRADLSRHYLRVRRTCFLYQNHYFELYDYVEPVASLWVLNVQVPDDGQEPVLPPFVSVDREITGDPEYSAYRISLRSRRPEQSTGTASSRSSAPGAPLPAPVGGVPPREADGSRDVPAAKRARDAGAAQ